MKKLALVAVTAVVIGLATAMAWAGSQDSITVGSVPVFAIVVGLTFLIQVVAFVPAFVAQSERFYDLTGSLTYITMTLLAAILACPLDLRSAIIAGLIIAWAARLGVFLSRRVRGSGKDRRFDNLKTSFLRFLNVWVLQGLWITLTAGAAWAAIASAKRASIDSLTIIGVGVWLLGFAVEVVADEQKRRFRADPANAGQFIRTGLWSWSRHPNYFGEIALWTGMALVAAPALQGWQLVTLISPFFVFILITRVSGLPLLERHADETWGGQPEYESYKERTSILVPLPPNK